MDNFDLKKYLTESKLNEETDKYLEYVNVVSLNLAKHLSGDNNDQYVEFANKIEKWFMDNRNRFSNVGDVA